MPVVGSASIATSGTPRAPAGVMPAWYDGWPNTVDSPPPAPYWNGMARCHDVPSADRLYFSVPHPVSQASAPVLLIAVAVPPTAVTYGSLVGESVCSTPVLATSSPSSPEENV